MNISLECKKLGRPIGVFFKSLLGARVFAGRNPATGAT